MPSPPLDFSLSGFRSSCLLALLISACPVSVHHAFSPADLKTLELSLKAKTQDGRGTKRAASPAASPAEVAESPKVAPADPKQPPEGYVFENHRLKKLKPPENKSDKIIYVTNMGNDRAGIDLGSGLFSVHCRCCFEMPNTIRIFFPSAP